MTCLGDLLKRIPENRELVRSSTTSINRDDLLLVAENNHHLSGLKVAICLSKIEDAMLSLATLDGVADQIQLLSTERPYAENVMLAEKAGSDILLCDNPEKIEHESQSLSVSRNIDELSNTRASHEAQASGAKTRWILTTSGTTGTPKLVSHTLESLSRTVKTDPVRANGQRWAMVYDYTRFAGLQVVLQTVLSGALLVAPDFSNALDAKVGFFTENACTHISATPTLWRKLVMMPQAKELPLKQITLGGEISDDRILSSLKALYPSARIAHIFASTEAGVGFSVADGRVGFPKEYLTSPPNGVEIKVEENRLYVRNPHVKNSYLGDEGTFAHADGFVDTGDSVEVTEDRILFLGRASGVINVGGDKVHPEEIEAVLMRHPSVAAARVYGKSNPITGALVVADIALSDPNSDPKELKPQIMAHASEHLERHKTPAMIKVITDFEINAAGKLIRTGS